MIRFIRPYGRLEDSDKIYSYASSIPNQNQVAPYGNIMSGPPPPSIPTTGSGNTAPGPGSLPPGWNFDLKKCQEFYVSQRPHRIADPHA